jgi:spore germination protein YaaH
MFSKIITILAGIVAGMFGAYFILSTPKTALFVDQILNKVELGKLLTTSNEPNMEIDNSRGKIVYGFLPFWLIDKAQEDYSTYLTHLSYFNIVIDSDGSIQKSTAPGESDPGWHALSIGKVDDYLSSAKSKGVNLSLTVFSSDDTKIDSFLSDPQKSAQNLMIDISPLISKYGFTDINLDIEKVSDATAGQRQKYIEFVSEVRKKLPSNVSLTIDVVATSFVKKTNLCDPVSLAKTADYIVIMGYDFHNPGSFVTGPVAPQYGAGVVSEFDIESAVQAAKALTPPDKLILAIPLYGYAWETIGNFPRAAAMPGSAYSISSRSITELLQKCTNCKTTYDETDAETHTIFPDEEGLYQQIFYPDAKSTQIKVNFANDEGLAGIALWALGYEDDNILSPLTGYLKQ